MNGDTDDTVTAYVAMQLGCFIRVHFHYAKNLCNLANTYMYVLYYIDKDVCKAQKNLTST